MRTIVSSSFISQLLGIQSAHIRWVLSSYSLDHLSSGFASSLSIKRHHIRKVNLSIERVKRGWFKRNVVRMTVMPMVMIVGFVWAGHCIWEARIARILTPTQCYGVLWKRIKKSRWTGRLWREEVGKSGGTALAMWIWFRCHGIVRLRRWLDFATASLLSISSVKHPNLTSSLLIPPPAAHIAVSQHGHNTIYGRLPGYVFPDSTAPTSTDFVPLVPHQLITFTFTWCAIKTVTRAYQGSRRTR